MAYNIDGVKDFHLDHIFDCGQCFRWERNPDGSYSGIAFGKMARMEYDHESSLLTIHGASEEDFEHLHPFISNLKPKLQCSLFSVQDFKFIVLIVS